MVSPMTVQKRIFNWGSTYPEVVAAALCAGLTVLGWLALQGRWEALGICLLLAGYAIGGYDSAREGLTTLWQERELDVDLLMIVAAAGAAALGLWQREYYLLVDGAILILIFAVSGALETVAMHRTERNIRSLMQLTPDTARRLRAGQEQVVATQALQVGDQILVKPGELIPVDGLIRTGHSTINQAPITGESIPVEKSQGDEVFAGTINGHGALTVELHKRPESSLIQRVIRLVEQAKTSQPPSQQFLERFERGYAQLIVISGLLLALVPPFWLGWTWEVTIYRSLIFLVVASPCALMASIMPALLSGIARGARQGILFKDGAQLETIGRVKAIAFDKTGTLTSGRLQVSNLVAAPGFQSDQVLRIIASLEAYSEHPIAQAIVQTAKQKNMPLVPADAVQAEVGQGIVGDLEGVPTRAGKLAYVTADLATPIDASLLQAGQRFESEGKTIIWVAQDQQAIGLLAVADQVRPQAAGLLSALRRMGIPATVMLTGDNAVTAQTVAHKIGVSEVYSDLLPEDKVTAIQHLQNKPGR